MVPRSWFQMRLAYSRSVAVTSIVGHVVGLGDRHVSNILIDQISGELVHIDLGIAFDQVCIIVRRLIRAKPNFDVHRVNCFPSLKECLSG